MSADESIGSKSNDGGWMDVNRDYTDLSSSLQQSVVVTLPARTIDAGVDFVSPSTTEEESGETVREERGETVREERGDTVREERGETVREEQRSGVPLESTTMRGCGHTYEHDYGMQLDGSCHVCNLFAKEVSHKTLVSTPPVVTPLVVNEKKHQCAQCGRSFKQRCKLTVHMLIHSDERPHGCEECGKRFKRKDKLLSHRRTHSNERPYKCVTCNKTFKRHDNLVAHSRRHDRTRRYWCPYCEKKFVISSEMRDHIRRVHPGLAIPSPAETIAHEEPEEEKIKMNLLLTGSGNSMTNSVTELFKSDSSAVLCSSEGSSTANLSAVKSEGNVQQATDKTEQTEHVSGSLLGLTHSEDPSLALSETYKEALAVDVSCSFSLGQLQLSDIVLHEGMYADVCVGYWAFCEVAVKVAHYKEKSRLNVAMDLVSLDGSAARWNIRHPNIMLVYGATVLTDGRFAVVSELLESSLSELISGLNETLNLRERSDLAMGVACGLSHLHRMGVVHGSVRPDHILITYTMTAKLTIPGIHGLFDTGGGTMNDSRMHRIRYGKYFSPERLSKDGEIIKRPTFESDVYGLVMTVSELIRFHLTDTEEEEQSPLLLALDYDPKRRCSVADIVKYLSSFRLSDVYNACAQKREVKGKHRNPVSP